MHCAQPGLYEAQQRSNKSSSLLPFPFVTSCSFPLFPAVGGKQRSLVGDWHVTGDLPRTRHLHSWRSSSPLCMSLGSASARYTCSPHTQSLPKPFFLTPFMWPRLPATGVLLQRSIPGQFPGELLLACSVQTSRGLILRHDDQIVTGEQLSTYPALRRGRTAGQWQSHGVIDQQFSITQSRSPSGLPTLLTLKMVVISGLGKQRNDLFPKITGRDFILFLLFYCFTFYL